VRQALAVEYPTGPEAISEPDAVMSNDDLSQHTTSTTTKKAREREYTTECWQIFEQIKEGKKVIAGKCLICGTKYKYNSTHSTGVFKRHEEKHDKKGDQIPTEHKTIRSKHNSTQGEGILSMILQGLGKFLLSILLEVKNQCQWHMTHFLRNLFGSLFIPNIKSLTGYKMNNELFLIFWSKRGDIYDEFKNAKYKVSITFDIWTAGKHNKSYCTVTAHWITDEINIGTWFLNKRLLALRVLDYPHDVETIFKFVLSIIEEFQCRDKIFAIGFDNASNYNAAMRLLTNTLKPIMNGIFFHSKFACHILNLIVKAGMEVDPVQELIGMYKDALKYVDSSIRKK
jgi:hypothetical protein